ncbi:DNA sulfur modification protein DndB [Streptomyces cyaneofuscatus]
MENSTTSSIDEDQIDISGGHVLPLQRIGPKRYLSSMPWGQLRQIVPDPRRAEGRRRVEYATADERQQAELRNEIQRGFRGAKQQNAREYARYLAMVLSGERAEGWSTPVFCLWLLGDLDVHGAGRLQGLLPQYLIGRSPFGNLGILLDGETQHVGHLLLQENPEEYGLDSRKVGGRMVGVEIHHSLTVREARQIFHDRNRLGVTASKSVGLSSDSFDPTTSIAHFLRDAVKVNTRSPGESVPFSRLVTTSTDQVKGSATHWMTFSSLRSFAATAIFGRSAVRGSKSIARLPAECRREVAEEALSEAADLLFNFFAEEFERRDGSVIAAPAVLAGLGVVLHGAMPWNPSRNCTLDEAVTLLAGINWDRDPRIWQGVMGKVVVDAATGARSLSMAGGIHEDGLRVSTALTDQSSPMFAQIRQPAS